MIVNKCLTNEIMYFVILKQYIFEKKIDKISVTNPGGCYYVVNHIVQYYKPEQSLEQTEFVDISCFIITYSAYRYIFTIFTLPPI